ncbi:hypothetical protein CsSME_00035772 [Camellia sinensis var. sinensis]
MITSFTFSRTEEPSISATLLKLHFLPNPIPTPSLGIHQELAQHPTVAQKVAGQLLLRSSPTQDLQAYGSGFQRPSMYQRQFQYENYTNAALKFPMLQPCRATQDFLHANKC